MLARIAAFALAFSASAPVMAGNDPLSDAYRSMIAAGETLGQELTVISAPADLIDDLEDD